MRVNIYTTMQWSNNANSQSTRIDYSTSTVSSYLNSSFKNVIDIRDHIKTVKLPYTRIGVLFNPVQGTNYPQVEFIDGANGMETQVFLLAKSEMDASNANDSSHPNLAVFKSFPAYRTGYLNGQPYTEWYRTVSRRSDNWNYVECNLQTYPGDTSIMHQSPCTNSKIGVRPAFILDPDLLMKEDGTVTYNQPPTTPNSFSWGTPVAGRVVGIGWGVSIDPDGTIASYQLARSVNNSGLVQIYEGLDHSYGDLVGGNWGTVQYAVRAVDNLGATSGYTTTPPKTVQNDILYISGPAPDMGSQPKPFTFTFGVGVSGMTSITQGIKVTASLDGYSIYTGTISTAQQVDLEMDVRTLGPGPHTVRVTADRELSIGAVENYTFTVPATALPPGGFGTQLQDTQGDVVFPQTVAGLVAGLKGKSVAENLAELFAAVEAMASATQAGLDLYKEDLGDDQ